MRWESLLLIAFTTAAATPAFGQALTPTVGGAGNGKESAASLLDFSGFWTKPHLGIEQPLSGPGPVVNKARTRQIFDIDGRRLPAASAPLVSSAARFIGDSTSPILNPQAAEVVKERGEMELGGMPFPSARNQCWPEGIPAALANVGMQLLQHRTRSRSFMAMIIKSVACA
jgi:hypothetical protein